MSGLITNIWNLFGGSPKTTHNKPKPDGNMETYADLGRKTRQQIAYHHLNGTDIPAIIKTAQTGIVGTGLSIQSRTKNEELDNSFEAFIKHHGKKRNFETTGRFSRDEFIEMCISEKFRKGGILIRHEYNTAWNIPYKLRAIPIDMIDIKKFSKEERIVNGIKKDKYGAIVSYFIYTDETKTTSTEIGASDISAYMDYWMDISQYSAVARISQLLPELDELLEYQKKELLAAGERSESRAFWHTSLYDTITDAINGLYKTAKANTSNITKENFEELTELQRNIMKKIALDGIVPAGGIKPLPQGDTLTQMENKTDSTYGLFTENISNKMTASQNRSRVITYKDMKNTNWATINALASIDESENAAEMRRIVESIFDDYLERLLIIGSQTNMVKLKWEEYRKEPLKYHKWEVLRQSLTIRDEVKLATANDKNLKNTLTTKEEIYAKRGKDYKTEMLKEAQTDIELTLEIQKMYSDNKLPIPEKYNQNQQEGESKND